MDFNKLKEIKPKEAVKAIPSKVKKAPKLAKAVGIKVHDKFRARFPKKTPKYYDAKKHERRYILKLAIIAFFIYLYIEEFARLTDGIFDGILFMVHSPLVFACNWLIIFATLTLTLLVRKRGFMTMMLSLVWILAGTTNGCILIKRMTPFTLYDMQNFEDGMTIVSTYFSKAQISLATFAIVVGVAIIILYFISCHRWVNINYKKSVLTSAFAIGSAIGCSMIMIHAGIFSTFFGNLNYAYTDYGFPYCFINTSVNTGISRPDDYSKEMIEKILKKHTTMKLNRELEQTDDSNNYPNIIVLQMESFTVAQDYNNIEVDKDPTPVFNQLLKDYTSGWFEVPACGAGTANTEFEVLTGISSKFFGPGEYPYKGKLRAQTLENMAYVCKSRGYTASALHDHRALFYNRNEVYADLGFDSFTSVEYMNNITKTPTGWARDEILIKNMMDIMKTTDTRDFMHVISVQGHGSYPTEQVFKSPYTTVTAKDEETKWKYEYYVNECHEMDEFIGNLIDAIEKTGEPTVMIVYGDHIPALDVKEADYANGDLYKTRYVIWDNIGLPKEDQDITSYEAGAILLEDAGLAHKGTIFDYQQSTTRSSKKYLENLKALSYDMIYGNNFVFGEKNPYKRANMTMGFREIRVDDVVKIGDNYYIRGQNFTERSELSLDGKVLKTIYLSPTLLGLQSEIEEEDVSRLQVSQVDSKNDKILTTIGALEEL